MDAKKSGILWGSLGSIVGGLSWIVVLGVALGSFWVVAMAVFVGILGFVVTVIFLNHSSERYFLMMGSLMSGLALANIAAINLFYERIPETINGITTGKESLSLPVINLFLILLLLAGLFFVFKDLLKKK